MTSIIRGKPISVPFPIVAGAYPTLPTGGIHLALAKEIAPSLRDFGFDPDPVIREAGLDPRLFEDGPNVIPYADLGRLFILSLARTNCVHFGLMVGQRTTIQSLGMIGRLMQHSETLGDALRALVSKLSIQNRGAVQSLNVSDGAALFTFSIYQPQVESADQISDGAMALVVNLLRSLCGSEWNPTEVLLPRTAPVDQEPYRRHFRAPVRFNQESATLVFPAKDLDRQIAGADAMMRALLEERIQQMKGAEGSEFSDDIRRLLRSRLTSYRCSADDVADLLAMHRRTLSRRLRGGGMGYRAIANEIRFEIARQLLTDTQVPLAQIAAALGYSEASAFTRAFRRWSGQTPKTWRNEGHHNPAPTA